MLKVLLELLTQVRAETPAGTSAEGLEGAAGPTVPGDALVSE